MTDSRRARQSGSKTIEFRVRDVERHRRAAHRDARTLRLAEQVAHVRGDVVDDVEFAALPRRSG